MTDQPVGPPGLGDPWDGLGPDVAEREEPTDAELLGLWPDPFAGPPDGDDAWFANAGGSESAGGEVPAGFGCGGRFDVLGPDAVLAEFVADAFDGGLGRLSDDELVGLMRASRRLSSWQAAVELGAVAELDQRRRGGRPDSSRLGEEVSAELAVALTLTGRSADALLCLARDLGRLPTVYAALLAGQIDRARAVVFAAELAAVSDTVAAAIAMALRGAAGGMTTGQLRAELRSLVLLFEPDAVRRRAERGRDQARVETWQEGSGNWGVAGRELPAADAITADKRITAIARALKNAGAAGNLDQLRTAVFVALLTGRDPETLAPRRQASTAPVTAGLTGTVHLTMPLATWLGSSDAPGQVAGLGPVHVDTSRDLATKLTADPTAKWCVTVTDADGRAAAHACARASPGGRANAGAWLASLQFEWLERGECGHPRQGRAYRPGRKLRHLINIRQRTCAHPGCRRPAEDCDHDHTIAYQQGGRTCECNCAPFCRRHHKIKQAKGWHVAQPEPGTLVWTAPHGRTYTVKPGRYPV